MKNLSNGTLNLVHPSQCGKKQVVRPGTFDAPQKSEGGPVQRLLRPQRLELLVWHGRAKEGKDEKFFKHPDPSRRLIEY